MLKLQANITSLHWTLYAAIGVRLAHNWRLLFVFLVILLFLVIVIIAGDPTVMGIKSIVGGDVVRTSVCPGLPPFAALPQ